ncbi:fibronectin type III domain-containing protein, partial [Streptomyces sp. P17]|uniref:fibronectin type III domain-containing protein n=1 Tax=Streptomyces sp. P17 TaxID=3074716 RepID=UPI0028F3F618
MAQFGNCGSSPTGITMSNITTSSANVSWIPVSGASSYVLRYKKVSETNWITLNLSNNNAVLANLLDNTAYEVQVSS